jgi:O-antigen ligase
VSVGTLPIRRHAWGRWLHRLRLPFPTAVTILAALALLLFGYGAILNLRSIKYLVALIGLGLIGCAFLILPRKFNFFLYALSFTLPFFVQFSIVERDRMVWALTGTVLSALVVSIVGLVTGAIDKSRLSLEPGITIPFVVFILACLTSGINTTDYTLTFIGITQELEMLFLFLVLINVVTDEERAVIFLRGLYLAFVLECLIYYAQNLLGFSFDLVGNTKFVGATDVEAGRIGSQRGTFAAAPAAAALYFSVLTLSLTGLYLSRRKLALRVKPMLGMALGGSCLILAAKRAPMSGFLLAILAMLLLISIWAHWAVRRLAAVVATLAIPFLIFLPIFLLRASADHEAAYEERINLTRISWNMVKAHPFLGVGYGTYDTMKRAFLPPEWKGWIYTVHNHYLLVLSEAGMLGFATLCILHLCVLRGAYRGIRKIASEFRPFQIAVVAGLLAMFWEQNWDIFNSRPQNYLFWLFAAMGVLLPRVFPAARSRQPA